MFTVATYPLIWQNILMFLVTVVSFRILVFQDNDKMVAPLFRKELIVFFSLVISLFFAFEPIGIYADKWLYSKDFFDIKTGLKSVDNFKDIGFYYYTKLITFITSSVDVFFFITALVYIWGYFLFQTRMISENYRFIFFLCAISSFGFFSYGTNTIRAGLALSFFLMALSGRYLLSANLLLIFIALLFHKSLALPVIALVITVFYNRKDHFLFFWIICFLASLVSGNFFINLFGELFQSSDIRVGGYLGGKQVQYKTGFRLDFILFSLIPIILGFYYKRKGFEDKLYNQILSMYIISNAVWLLVIRMPFTDRVATLSWFLIPFVILYPLLKKRIFEHQHYWIAAVLFINAFITYALSVLR